MRISFTYHVTLESDGSAKCQPQVFLLDGEVDEVEDTGLEVDELLYRCITWQPPLPDSLAKCVHEWEFQKWDGPLFRYINPL